MAQHGFGRLPAVDPRDQNFTIRRLIEARPPLSIPGSKYWWANGIWLDQGETDTCVGHALVHWLKDATVTHQGKDFDPFQIYHEAQMLDEFPGENYAGTSVRGGAKALQARGLISSYHWTWEINEMVQTTLTMGPVVIGINWYETMMQTDPDGLMHIGGQVLGGHCVVADGANSKKELVRLKNSWGRANWGKQGFGYIRFSDLERLIKEDGEVLLAVEIP